MLLKILIFSETDSLEKYWNPAAFDYPLEAHFVYTMGESLLRLRCFQYSLVWFDMQSSAENIRKQLSLLKATTLTPVLGFCGADDTKVFNESLRIADDCVKSSATSGEIFARSTALMEYRPFVAEKMHANRHIYSKGLLIIPLYRRVYVNQQEVHLTLKQYGTLLYLATNQEQVISSEQIYCKVWHEDTLLGVEGAVAQIINGLRGKLAQYSSETYIENVWGMGFRFSGD